MPRKHTIKRHQKKRTVRRRRTQHGGVNNIDTVGNLRTLIQDKPDNASMNLYFTGTPITDAEFNEDDNSLSFYTAN